MAKIDFETMKKRLRIQRYKEIADYENVINLGIDAMWKELCSRVTEPDVDPTDIFSEEVEYLKNLDYSMKLMNICCISETWEQDLYNFLKEKGLITVYSNDYWNTKKIFERAYPSCQISNYPQIEEMRALVNAIKHGEGNSLTNIRRMTSDTILADSNLGVAGDDGVVVKRKEIEFDPNTLTSRTLNVEGRLQVYADTIVKFWEDVFAVERESSSSSESE